MSTFSEHATVVVRLVLLPMSVFTSARSSVDPFQTWLERCRTELDESRPPSDVPEGLTTLVRDLPRAFTRSQRESAQGLLTRLLCRMAARCEPPVADALATHLLTLLARDYDESWREDWTVLVQRIADHGCFKAARAGYADPRVERALTAIEQRSFDPQFRLSDLANDLAISACRLTQLLKAETGSTFGAHVQRRRIAHACVLLGESTLSIKEVACRVGYQTTTQLDRQFKRHTSLHPSAYRRSLERPPLAVASTLSRRAAPVRSQPMLVASEHAARPFAATLLQTKQQN